MPYHTRLYYTIISFNLISLTLCTSSAVAEVGRHEKKSLKHVLSFNCEFNICYWHQELWGPVMWLQPAGPSWFYSLICPAVQRLKPWLIPTSEIGPSFWPSAGRQSKNVAVRLTFWMLSANAAHDTCANLDSSSSPGQVSHHKRRDQSGCRQRGWQTETGRKGERKEVEF